MPEAPLIACPKCPKCGGTLREVERIVIDKPVVLSCGTCGVAQTRRVIWAPLSDPAVPEVRTGALPGVPPDAQDVIIARLANYLDVYGHQHRADRRIRGCPVCDILGEVGK